MSKAKVPVDNTSRKHVSNMFPTLPKMFARCLEYLGSLGTPREIRGGESGMSSLSWINNIYKHLQKICSDYEKICSKHATSIAQSLHSSRTVIAHSLLYHCFTHWLFIGNLESSHWKRIAPRPGAHWRLIGSRRPPAILCNSIYSTMAWWCGCSALMWKT